MDCILFRKLREAIPDYLKGLNSDEDADERKGIGIGMSFVRFRAVESRERRIRTVEGQRRQMRNALMLIRLTLPLGKDRELFNKEGDDELTFLVASYPQTQDLMIESDLP